jgi:hypothetical protein
MARNLAQRLDRLERLAAALLTADTSPVYVREGEAVPEGVEPERVVFIVRTFIEPPMREEEALPTVEKLEEDRPATVQQRQPLFYPDLGLA